MEWRYYDLNYDLELELRAENILADIIFNTKILIELFLQGTTFMISYYLDFKLLNNFECCV